MLPVLDLDPILRPAAVLWPVAALRHQSLKPHAAGGAKQVRADLPLFERRHEDAVRPAHQQAGEVGLAQGQRQIPQIVAFFTPAPSLQRSQGLRQQQSQQRS